MNDKVMRAKIEAAKSAIRLLQQWVQQAEDAKPNRLTLTEIGSALVHDAEAIQNGTSKMLEYV